MAWIILVAMLLIPSMALAQQGVVCKKSTCKLTWLEPQTQTDGSNLSDLKEYHVWLANTAAAVQALTVPTFVVQATSPDPVAGAVVTFTGVRTLVPGQWYAQVSAANTVGNEGGGRTAVVPFVLQNDAAPLAPATPTISD